MGFQQELSELEQTDVEEGLVAVSKRTLVCGAEASCDNSPEHAKNSRSKVRRVSGEFQQVTL